MHERQVAETGRHPAGGEVLVRVLWGKDDVRRRWVGGRTGWGMELMRGAREREREEGRDGERRRMGKIKVSFGYSGDAGFTGRCWSGDEVHCWVGRGDRRDRRGMQCSRIMYAGRYVSRYMSK